MDEIIELVRPDAEALDCVDLVEHARVIAQRGTSADRQLDVYRKALAGGDDASTGLRKVVADLAEETVAGV